MHYFPSKKVIVVAVFALGILAWVMFDSSSLVNLKNGVVVTLSVAESSTSLPDSDNDGLLDWNEDLLGTSKNNFDSDNDGIPDGEQYASIKNISYVGPTDDVLNYLSQLGNAVANNGASPQLPEAQLVVPDDHYVQGDLVLVPTSTSTVFLYVTNTLLAFENYPDPSNEEVLDIVSRWLEFKEPSDLKLLSNFSVNNIVLSAEIAELEVPDSLIELHLKLINSLYLSGAELEKIDTTVQNPIENFFATANYANFRSKRSQAIIELTQYYFDFLDINT